MKKQLLVFGTACALALAGCGNGDTEEPENTPEPEQQAPADTQEETPADAPADPQEGEAPMEGMHHSDDGTIPEGLQEAENPKYPVGSEAVIHTDHMAGMDGAKATIVGAFDTTAYSIDYTPTTGGDEVKDHKWVIQEEIENPPAAPIEKGTEVTVTADHMEGMEGAKAKIVSSEDTTVYMVDYMPTDGGDEVKNHKWVTEEELSAE